MANVAVEFLVLTSGGQQTRAGIVTWSESVGVSLGLDLPDLLREELALDGLQIGGERLTTADGRRFVETLPAAYSGTYLRARRLRQTDAFGR